MDEAPTRAVRPRTLALVLGALLVVGALVTVILVLRGSGQSSSDPAQSTPGASSTVSPPVTPAAPPSAAPTSAAPTNAAPTPKPSVPSPTASGKPTVVPTQPVETTRAPLRDTAKLASGVDVTVSALDSVEGEARGPGEVAGPALRVTITVKNTTDKPVSIEAALLNLYVGAGRTPAGALSGPGVEPLPAVVAPKSSVVGRYVFSVPPTERQQLEVEFSYSTSAPIVVFTGSA